MKNINCIQLSIISILISLVFLPAVVKGENLTVHAKGTEAQGEFAHFKVLVDGQEIGDAFTTDSCQSYTFQNDKDPSEVDEVRIIFDNDITAGNENRNLYVKSIRFGQYVPIYIEPDIISYISSDGKELEYNGFMEVNSELILDFRIPALSCIFDNVTLSTQKEVDEFLCKYIDGYLNISGDDITNLLSLSSLRGVGRIRIQNNPKLKNLDGLSSLKYIGEFIFEDNPLVEEISGFNSFEGSRKYGTGIAISSNNSLRKIEGFNSLPTGYGYSFNVSISNNLSLESINGFNSIKDGDLFVEENPNLKEIYGFSSLTNAVMVRINNNKCLKNFNLSALSSVGYHLVISNNQSLENIDGLKSLEVVMDIILHTNLSLKNIDGLKSLKQATEFILEYNPSLRNISSLKNLKYAEVLFINENSNLDNFCGLYPLFSEGHFGYYEFINNGIEITKEEILANGPCDYAEIVVNAKGSEAGGENAHFKVLVNNQEIGDDYATSDYQPYRFPLSVDPSAIQNIQIVFDNDTIIDGEDRDLYIHSIEYGDSLFVLENTDVLYYDEEGNELNYDNGMPWNGTLVLDFTTPEPPIASDISLCEGDTIPVLSASGKNLKWYQDTGLKTLLHSGSNFKPASIDAGTYNYYVTQTLNGRESNPDTLTLIINNTPELPICSDVTYCEGDPIAELHASGNNIRWYHDRELTNLISTGNNLNSESTAPGVYHYFPTQTMSGCESDPTTLTLTIHKKPSAPICNDVIVCEDDSLIALQASGDSIHWYDDDQLSNLVANGNRYKPVDIRPGKYSFYLIQIISGCAGYIDSVELTIKETPAPPQFSNVSVCFAKEVPALTADGTNINWYDDGYLTNLLQSGNALYPEHDQVGQYNYYVTQTFDACESRADTANLTIYSLPLFNLGEDTTITSDAEILLTIVDDYQSYMWSTGSILNFITIDGKTIGSGEHSFSLKVEDSNHCAFVDTINITVLLPTGLDNNSIEELITIYPNPAFDHLHVHISNYSEGAYRFEMFDLSGKLQLLEQIYVKEINERLDFDLFSLQKGVYIAHFSSNNIPQIRKKVVIQ